MVLSTLVGEQAGAVRIGMLDPGKMHLRVVWDVDSAQGPPDSVSRPHL